MKILLGLGLALLSGCGGSVRSTSVEQAGSGGVMDRAGSSNGGSNVAGAGDGNAGASSGSGGKLPDFPGGAGAGPLACSAPYAGPSGGPRADGPLALGSCQAIPDDVVLARYKEYSARVPRGLYYEPDESITFWNEPCSKSMKETAARGATDGLGTLSGSFQNEWYYEAVYCFNDLRRIERNLRCDYFDGSQLAEPTPERLAFLASLLWWGSNGNSSGAAILGYSVSVGDATDVVDLCTISVTHADFGLCDEVRLESTKHRLRVPNGVELGTPQVIRTLRGDCQLTR